MVRRVTITVAELLAREEITDVIKRLARGTDRLDEQMMVSCYHPDGYDDHNSFRGSAADFGAWVCEVLPHFQATMHFVGPPNIRFDPPLAEVADNGVAVAQVDTYCTAHHVADASDMVMGLRYVDRFERRDGVWLIAKRVCAFDWAYTVPFDPTVGFRFAEDFTVGHRDRTDITYTGV
jgi:hypothetical protein